LLSKLAHIKLHKNSEYPLGSLHLLSEIKECKPQDLYKYIFGQHDPGKTPMEKPVGREILFWRSQAKIATRNNNKVTWYNSQLLLELGFGVPWEMHTPWDLRPLLALPASFGVCAQDSCAPFSLACAPFASSHISQLVSSCVPLPLLKDVHPSSSSAPLPLRMHPHSSKQAPSLLALSPLRSAPFFSKPSFSPLLSSL
jgi:hypothetical protein